MNKQELLSLLYVERQRLLDRYVKPGWNRWVLLGAMIYCIFSFIDSFDKHDFKISNVISLLTFLSFSIITFLLLFSNRIVSLFRGVIEEQLKLKSIKKIKLIVGYISKFVIVVYIINAFLFNIQFFNIGYLIDYAIVLKVLYWTSWITLFLLSIYIILAPIFDNKKIKAYKCLLFGNISMFVPLYIIYYYQQFSIVDFRYSIILIVFAFVLIIYWYSSKEIDLSDIDYLIDDVILFEEKDYDKVFIQLKIITLNTSIDNLYIHKYKVIKMLALEMDRSLYKLTKDLGLLKADYFSKSNAKQIRENFFKHSSEFRNSYFECLEHTNQILNELKEALNNIRNIRKKNRLLTSKTDVEEVIENLKYKTKKYSALLELAKTRLPKCISCENCEYNCEEVKIDNNTIL